MESPLVAQTREAFIEAFPAHKFHTEFSHDISAYSGASGVLVKIVRTSDDSLWRGLVIKKADIPVLIEKAKEKIDA